MMLSEYIPGESLAIYRASLDSKQEILRSLDLVYQLVDGLEYIHQKNIVHRDIKPENIMIHNPIPVYIDFDLACFYDMCGDGKIGTPYYMAPEVWLAAVNDWKMADVYSLGATLFYVFNNHKRPYNIRDMERLEQAIVSPIIPSPESHSGFEPLDKLIQTMIEKLPGDRPHLSSVKETVQMMIKSVMQSDI